LIGNGCFSPFTTGVCAILIILFVRLPTGFLPSEDQGAAFTQFRLPAVPQ
jgi:multidrug efflux pump subunit AcrB